MNTSPHLRGKPTEADITPDTLYKLGTAVITKKSCLRIISSQYDPLGVASCALIGLKVKLKELHKLGIDWDTPLHGNLREEWIKLFEMLVLVGKIKFMRSTKPDGVVGSCVLVCYFDGSDLAFGFVIYARWEMSDGSVFVNLVASKARIAPLFGTSTPRVELEGATLLTRVVVRVIRALVQDPPSKIYFLGDSETVLACRERDRGFFGEFFGNRIGEQHDNVTRIQNLVGDIGIEWYHVASSDNAADTVTRLKIAPEFLQQGSGWLEGPEYLKLPVEDWPIDRNFAERKNKVCLPIDEVRKQYRDYVGHTGQVLANKGESVGPGSSDNYVLKHFGFGHCTNDWRKLIQRTANLFIWYVKVLEKKGPSILSVAEEIAVTFWVRAAMPATNLAASHWKLKHLNPQQHFQYQDMLVVVGRVQLKRHNLLGNDYLHILMSIMVALIQPSKPPCS